MPAIYSTTEFKRNLKDIKGLAKNEPVFITENGNGAYVFISQDLYQKEIEQSIEDALYEFRVSEALERASDDIENGRIYTSAEDMFAAAEALSGLAAEHA